MERKCPKCGSLEARVGISITTLMGWSPYYDKDGNYHNDNPNTTTTQYICGSCFQKYTTREKNGIILEVIADPNELM